MEEQLKSELARITQQIQGLSARREQLLQQVQQLNVEITMLRGEGRLSQKLLTPQLNIEDLAEAGITAEIIEEE